MVRDLQSNIQPVARSSNKPAPSRLTMYPMRILFCIVWYILTGAILAETYRVICSLLLINGRPLSELSSYRNVATPSRRQG